LKYKALNREMFMEHQISMKDHVTLKTEEMSAENSALPSKE